MLRKYFATLTVVISLMLLFTAPVYAAEESAAFGSSSAPSGTSLQISSVASGLQGGGTEQNPYIIAKPNDLAAISKNLSACYALGNDIDMKGVSFTPIGTANTPFTGMLDGRGHAIKNFTSYSSSSTITSKEAGLFAYTSKARFKNINITNVSVNLTVLRANNSARVGLLSLNDDSSSFQNIKLSGKMKLDASIVEAGGLVCTAKGSQVSNVASSIVIDYTCDKSGVVGGIVCVATGASIQGCSNSGAITNKDSDSAAAGILGSGKWSFTEISAVSNCANTGRITACYSAGIVSGTRNSTYYSLNVSNCRNSGAITSFQYKNLDGIVSGISSAELGSVTKCINTGELKANYNGGVVNGISYSHEITECENRGNIEAGVGSGIGSNSSRSSTQDSTGAIIDETYSHIVKCVNRGSINADVAEGVGGFVVESSTNLGNINAITAVDGIASNARFITDCKNYGNLTQNCTDPQITIADQRATGIADKVAKRISGCYNYGNVTGCNACGVVRTNNGEVAECYNAGTVKAKRLAAGIAGINADLVDNCYNVGSVSGNKAGGIVVTNNKYGVVTNCYNVGALDGKDMVGAIAVDNANNVINSYYFNGTPVGVGVNQKGARDATKALTNEQLTKQEAYSAFEFAPKSTVATTAVGVSDKYENESNSAAGVSVKVAGSGKGTWVMSPNSKMPRLARMTANDEVYVKAVAVKSHPSSSVMGKALKKSDVKLKITYSNNRKVTISSGFKFGTYKKKLGKRTIPVYFAGKKVSFKTVFAPAAPKKMTLKAKGRSIQVQFTKIAKAKGYEVFRSTKAKTGFKKVKSIKAGEALAFTDGKLKAKTTYYYKVRSTSGKYKGVFSKAYRAKTGS